jgi:hypothetical protein
MSRSIVTSRHCDFVTSVTAPRCRQLCVSRVFPRVAVSASRRRGDVGTEQTFRRAFRLSFVTLALLTGSLADLLRCRQCCARLVNTRPRACTSARTAVRIRMPTNVVLFSATLKVEREFLFLLWFSIAFLLGERTSRKLNIGKLLHQQKVLSRAAFFQTPA